MWLSMGHTDMRKGMQGLALLMQEHLKRDPHLCVGRDYVAELRRCPPGLPSLESSAT
ncbi:IS66 family insertion sequence element accessory protein TnpB [Neomesorhizobium albiziae]|uniref:IS66 family insertion sequence element accessory protein TnpB n=1 Tax=Neomesorhizobium albiziae TaxID=335020 RepID=UPI002453335D|nr:IS66 family insertion sequence element accessory protein TnpB [Mesorhizobium albiziae]